ncbi:hypothetical protein M758_1G241600 [Ceratodon purpureus]|uniref:Uncharacterized protein n=1 Tax=Ceratodon purpureus TaxID=3225 RepID=A0A8T0JC17_CERPU|nr:hypothetical protein KC19_1G247000 [Ceratodon purpureus]KAG0631298.1 hypothetical protein M758_1G241600 [Ceratodon purpureus]
MHREYYNPKICDAQERLYPNPFCFCLNISNNHRVMIPLSGSEGIICRHWCRHCCTCPTQGSRAVEVRFQTGISFTWLYPDGIYVSHHLINKPKFVNSVAKTNNH